MSERYYRTLFDRYTNASLTFPVQDLELVFSGPIPQADRVEAILKAQKLEFRAVWNLMDSPGTPGVSQISVAREVAERAREIISAGYGKEQARSRSKIERLS